MVEKTKTDLVNDRQRAGELGKKILTVMAQLGTLDKDGVNMKQSYTFVSYEALNARLTEILPRNGLALIPSFDEYIEREIQNKSGQLVTRTIVKGTMMILDTTTGYAVKCRIIGADNDTAGKSGGKAETEAVKRFEMKLFHVTTKDEQDPDGHGIDINNPFAWNPGNPQSNQKVPQQQEFPMNQPQQPQGYPPPPQYGQYR